jgi:preprotein translocase subunit YajC
MLFLQAGGISAISNFALPIMIFVVFYFFMIRPQMTKQKSQAAFEESLEKGKEVVTASGIIAKVNKIDGAIITLEVANGTFIRVIKSAISKEMTEAFAAKV